MKYILFTAVVFALFIVFGLSHNVVTATCHHNCNITPFPTPTPLITLTPTP